MNRVQLTKTIWEKYDKLTPVCDIGCGHNIIFDFDYTRFDKAEIMHDKQTAANVYGDFHDMFMFKDNHFGFISSSHSLEHTRDIKKALNEWIRILKIGGIMFLTWPGYLEKKSKNELELCKKWDESLSQNDIKNYLKFGGEMGWVSTDTSGKLFLDDHFNLVTLAELKHLLPKNVTVLEEIKETKNTDSQIVIRKIKN